MLREWRARQQRAHNSCLTLVQSAAGDSDSSISSPKMFHVSDYHTAGQLLCCSILNERLRASVETVGVRRTKDHTNLDTLMQFAETRDVLNLGQEQRVSGMRRVLRGRRFAADFRGTHRSSIHVSAYISRCDSRSKSALPQNM